MWQCARNRDRRRRSGDGSSRQPPGSTELHTLSPLRDARVSVTGGGGTMSIRAVCGGLLVLGVACVVVGITGVAEARTPRIPEPGQAIHYMQCVPRNAPNIVRTCGSSTGVCPPTICIPAAGVFCVCTDDDFVCKANGVAPAVGTVGNLAGTIADPSCTGGTACIYANTATNCTGTYETCQ